MIEYVKNGERFSTSFGGTRDSYNEITEDSYNQLSALSNSELDYIVEESLSDAIRYGYGYYGCRLSKQNGKYFLVKTIGTSCE